ncbi:MAG: TatD family hydrolase [Oscillospiraceae bacterium]|nr:TatD family hydrolase [Oscillospiraceae bacterium]
MTLFDTHAHYTDKRFDEDRDALLAALPAADVARVIVPGVDITSSRRGAALAEAYSYVWAAAGIHPHDAAHAPPDMEAALFALAGHRKVAAIGEIGLDYHYDFSPRDVQRAVFRRQMEAARALSLPVIIHDREAHADVLEIVRAFPDVRGVFHCYSGSLESAKILVSLGWYLSFTGVVTYKNARRLLETAAWLPADRILIETDAPYLTPEPHRGRRNDSRHVRLVAEALARARGVSPEEIAALTWENGHRLFDKIPAAPV